MAFPDPTVTARAYLHPRLDAPVFLDEPDSDTYDYREPCVIIKDVGSRVLYQSVFLDAFLHFDVRGVSRETCETLAGRVHDLMNAWESVDSSVVIQDGKDFPKWSPEADRRIPAYEFSFRAWLRPSTK